MDETIRENERDFMEFVKNQMVECGNLLKEPVSEWLARQNEGSEIGVPVPSQPPLYSWLKSQNRLPNMPPNLLSTYHAATDYWEILIAWNFTEWIAEFDEDECDKAFQETNLEAVLTSESARLLLGNPIFIPFTHTDSPAYSGVLAGFVEDDEELTLIFGRKYLYIRNCIAIPLKGLLGSVSFSEVFAQITDPIHERERIPKAVALETVRKLFFILVAHAKEYQDARKFNLKILRRKEKPDRILPPTSPFITVSSKTNLLKKKFRRDTKKRKDQFYLPPSWQ